MNQDHKEKAVLTFEINNRDRILEIHANETGILKLIGILANFSKKKEPDHIHLMTDQWGGEELSSNKIGDENILINHVKIFKW